MSLSQFKEVLSHGRGEYTSAQQPWDHGLEVISAVMPILEFCQVSWDMFFGDGVISSSQGSFDISQDGVDPIEAGKAGAFVALSLSVIMYKHPLSRILKEHGSVMTCLKNNPAL